MSRDIVEGLAERFDQIRYWRFLGRRCPEGVRRKLMGRLMLREISWLGASPWMLWPTGGLNGRAPTLFLDPLYVIRSAVRHDDIVLCYDIGPVANPELFNAATTRAYAMAYAKIWTAKPGVVFVSDASRRAFCDRYGEDFRFLKTIPLYARPAIEEGEAAPVSAVSRPFLLTVAGVEPRKNHLRILEAYRRSGLHERGISYVFCGPRGEGCPAVLSAASRTSGVVALGYVPEQKLRWLYRNGIGFVLPSLLEGFGVPALEAAALGLVPLVGRGGAQEEAIDGAGILVDPTSIESIAEGLKALVDMGPVERTALLRRAKARADALTRDRFLRSWAELLSCNGVPEAL